MAPLYQLIEHPDYLEMIMEEHYDYKEYSKLPAKIVKECSRIGTNRILIDGRPVAREELPIVERFFMAEKAAETFGNQFRVAIIWNPALIDGFMEAVATNRESQLRIFGDPEKAKHWLMLSGEDEREA